MAVGSFRHKGLSRFYETGTTRGIGAENADKLQDMLAALDDANTVDDVEKVPGWRLHALTGDLAGYWAMAVTGNRRLIFTFEDGEAHDIDLVDYH